HWPSWFDPTPVDFSSGPYGPFAESRALTAAGDVRIVPLPGHTPGHLGVVVEDAGHVVLLAGDASYNEELLLRGAVDGVSPDERLALQTQERIRALAAERPTVYAVAHDPETGARVAERRVIPADRARRAAGDAPAREGSTA